MSKDNYTKYFKCRYCGQGLTLNKKWEGRPQGPQCQCNPDSWGNWIKLKRPLEKSITLCQ